MRWIIDGKAYRPESLQDISITDLRTIQRETGRSMREITAALESTAPAHGGSADLDVTEMDDDQLCALSVLFWHARKTAGDRGADGGPLGIEEAASFPLAKLVVEMEPGDEVEAPPNRNARRRAAATKIVQRRPTSKELAG